MKKRLTFALLLILFLFLFLWACINLWNGFHFKDLIFLLESPWLLAATIGSLNLYTHQQAKPKIQTFLTILILLGLGIFVYGSLRDIFSVLLLSFILFLIAGMISLVSFTPWLKQATSDI